MANFAASMALVLLNTAPSSGGRTAVAASAGDNQMDAGDAGSMSITIMFLAE